MRQSLTFISDWGLMLLSVTQKFRILDYIYDSVIAHGIDSLYRVLITSVVFGTLNLFSINLGQKHLPWTILSPQIYSEDDNFQFILANIPFC